jgi:selenocysteine-specific elongation factor
MKKHTIIGTAGHIDHGKTAVIQALTGVDTDRLKEEKERGITIDIGFAYWKDNVTILDVPGHEKFIRNMVAGVNTVDFFLLVIAADDGIMPQTVEHLDILNFFNIKDGIIVINKTDLVDAEWLSLVNEETITLLRRYSLDHLPIFHVSAHTNQHIDQLREAIEQKILTLKDKESDQPFRLFIDRSFIIKGHGTIVTGTVLSGNLKKGEDVQIIPSGQIRKVRGLQTHIKDIPEVYRGDRAAINLQGISKSEIVRGDALVSPESLLTTHEFIGTIRTVTKIPIKIQNHSTVRVYVGTAERIAHLLWFENKKYLEDATDYHVRLKLEQPMAAAPDDPFLLRLHSPLVTLAGGRILEINPPRIPHRADHWHNYFSNLSSADLKEILKHIIVRAGFQPLSAQFLQQKLHQNKSQIQAILEKLLKTNTIRTIKIKGSDHYIDSNNLDRLLEKIIDFISGFHQKNPHIQGLNQQELKTRSGFVWLKDELYEMVLQKLINSGRLRNEQNIYYLSTFAIQMSKNIDGVKSELLDMLEKARFAPPAVNDICQKLDMPEKEIRTILNLLKKESMVIAIQPDMFVHHRVWEELIGFLIDYFSYNEHMPVVALKEYINTTRKFAIPIFEYLDSEGYTTRQGDVRMKGHRL